MAARAFPFLPIPTASGHSSAPDKPTCSPSPPPNHHAVRTPSSFRATTISLAQFPPFPRPILRSAALVAFVLPTANPERASAGKMPSNGGGNEWGRWSWRAVKSFSLGQAETTKLYFTKMGTETLLMGILLEGTSEAAKFLRANGITLSKVREVTMKPLGRINNLVAGTLNPPLTKSAQCTLDWAVDEKLKSGEDGEITVAHMLLGIWSNEKTAGHNILASLGFDDQKAMELAKIANEES